MTVTLNKKEILNRAYLFMKDYADASYEMGQAQDFIRELCEVFGFSHKRWHPTTRQSPRHSSGNSTARSPCRSCY